MRALTDGVHVVTGEHGTIVRLTVRLQPAHAVMSAATAYAAPGPSAPAAARPPAVAAPPEEPAAAAPPDPAEFLPAPLIEVHEDGPRPPSAETLGGAQIEVRVEDGAPVVAPTGDLDLSNAARFLEALERVAATAQGLIVVTLEGVSYFDSQGVRALLRAQQRLAASRCRLAIVAPAGSTIRRLIDVAGLGAALPLFDTVEDAIARRAT